MPARSDDHDNNQGGAVDGPPNNRGPAHAQRTPTSVPQPGGACAPRFPVTHHVTRGPPQEGGTNDR